MVSSLFVSNEWVILMVVSHGYLEKEDIREGKVFIEGEKERELMKVDERVDGCESEYYVKLSDETIIVCE